MPFSPRRWRCLHSEDVVTDEPSPVLTAEVVRIRQDYLHRLGIQKAKSSRISQSPVVADGSPEPFFPGHEDVQEDMLESSAAETKGQENFRVNLLRKLSYTKVWVPAVQRPPKSQTVTLFDWDDTLLCTSHLEAYKDQPLPSSTERILRDVGKVVKQLLDLACRHGHTFIVTNAQDGWVEYSAAKWVPDLLPTLRSIRIISARSKYEPKFPEEVHQWKIQAFLEVRRQLDSEVVTNLLAVGDSDFEMEAAQVMGREFLQALIKTIRFQQNPSPQALFKELSLATQQFTKIVESARNLKVSFERKTPSHMPGIC